MARDTLYNILWSSQNQLLYHKLVQRRFLSATAPYFVTSTFIRLGGGSVKNAQRLSNAVVCTNTHAPEIRLFMI